ncbi:hypothetical protein [Mycolicibacterium fortuitum]|uniref:hypothetical protein n=2 Tax=Mycolicibacterium fortuitum TaxID=1766 RepID=UPI0007EA6647|nr:hypothetical protein [Mycolicibacterium fortuitum]MDG5772938.1 hypothetical protein [Mycolicibacterium fortuitum]MDV7195451.1 hypothetical protein [Mycolicibacterium fortuitum]NOQ62303.1 hypothetical protein [Mycolicibacterium fortuitum]OBB49399.1 hypothetical protein A5754_30335 [Mycolicibacterium fortuitum]OBB59115.1 hypothetical protein A5755_26500 [Mycolicibacterium fortuitum]
MPAVVRTTVHPDAHAVVTRAAAQADVDLVKTTANAPAAQLESACSAATVNPFDAALATASASYRAEYSSAAAQVAKQGVAIGFAAVAGLIALDETDAANSLNLATVTAEVL